VNKENIISLIEEFEIASNSTKELLGSIDVFKDVLSRYYESLGQIDDMRKEIRNSSLSEHMENINKMSTDLNSIYNSVANSVDSVNSSIKEIHKYNNENMNKMNDLNEFLQNLLKAFKNIEGTALKISNLNTDSIENIAGSLEEKSNQIDKSMNNMKKITSEFSLNVSNKLSTMEEQLDKSIEIFDSKHNKLSNDIIELTNTNQNIHDTLEIIKTRNDDAMDAFFMIIDEWADKNIHGIAIKRKKQVL
jgi:methyl-accepting chemotaxis protein